jgi:uncharacterized RDD family membrane protein YckC
VDPIKYSSLKRIERSKLLHQLQPSWANWIMIASLAWIMIDTVVFLSNKRKQAFHDFIAGTIVIRKQYLKL